MGVTSNIQLQVPKVEIPHQTQGSLHLLRFPVFCLQTEKTLQVDRGKGLGASQQGCSQGHIWGNCWRGGAWASCVWLCFVEVHSFLKKNFVLYYCILQYSQFRLSQWLSNEEYICQSRRCRFYSWVWKIPWRRKWQPIPAFLPREFHGQRSLAGCSPQGSRESDMTE